MTSLLKIILEISIGSRIYRYYLVVIVIVSNTIYNTNDSLLPLCNKLINIPSIILQSGDDHIY